jgi:hypothetical protein
MFALVACGKKTDAPVAIGRALQPFGALNDVTIGMPVDELARKVPELDRWESKFAPGYWLYTDQADYSVVVKQSRVAGVTIQLFHRPVTDVWNAWGSGTPMPDQKTRRYFDETHGLRAEVYAEADDCVVVNIAPYTPLAKLLDGPDPYSLAGVAIFGRPIDDVLADLRAHQLAVVRNGDDVSVSGLPESEWSGVISGDLPTEGLSAWINVDRDGTARSWAIRNIVVQAPDSARAAILALYEHKWGAPKAEHGGHDYGSEPWVEVNDSSLSLLFHAHKSQAL